ncbi:acylphosphatase [Vibrio sp.]|uniref:acylphosphatase n=1 Tax=Vibrio sp. TaxID=678 RepID=UPI003D0ABF2D
MNEKCVKFTVTGFVQGVGFRYHTCHQGLQLGLNGYAKNLPNGDVEVMVLGQDDAIDKMAAWLQQGPRTASVNHVTREDAPLTTYRGFEIL